MPAAKPELHDPRVLRAIAHPVRNLILTALDATGPLRAADVATELGIPANQASFHLRQLAKYGLAVEAPEEARDGRDRVWKSAHESGLNVDTHSLAEAPGGKAAVQVFRRVWSDSAHEAVDRAERAERDPDTRVMVSDVALRLTREEVDRFSELSGRLDDLEQQPGGRAASAVFRQNAASWGHAVVDAAYHGPRDPETLRTVNESAVRLTQEEAGQLAEELDAVIATWTERTRGRDPDRRTYLWFSVLQPYPETLEREDG